MPDNLEINKIYNFNYKDKINLISNNSVDMVLTDIPYLISRQTNLKTIKNFNKKDGDSSWSGIDFGKWDKCFDIKDYLYHCCRILKPSCSIIVWAAWQQLKLVDDLIKEFLEDMKGEPRIGIWRKTNPNVFNMDIIALQPYEFFVWNRKGSNSIFNNQNGRYINQQDKTVREHPEIHFYEHPCLNNSKLEGEHEAAKPEAIFEWLIRTYTNELNNNNEKSIIFDGCMGGGTTAVAAIKAKRNFIGFEFESEYCVISKKRLDKLGIKDSIVNT